jgi:hypothetical protein
MLPLACARVAVKGARGECSVNKLNCTSLQPCGCGAWGRVGDVGTSGGPLEDIGVLDVMSWIGTLEPGYMTAPFATVLEVTLQVVIRPLL